MSPTTTARQRIGTAPAAQRRRSLGDNVKVLVGGGDKVGAEHAVNRIEAWSRWPSAARTWTNANLAHHLNHVRVLAKAPLDEREASTTAHAAQRHAQRSEPVGQAIVKKWVVFGGRVYHWRTCADCSGQAAGLAVGYSVKLRRARRVHVIRSYTPPQLLPAGP